jgi:CHASE3 domain sensor protein
MAVLLAVTSAVLLGAIIEMGDAGTAARHSKAALISAGRLERLLFDLEADSHALVRTGDQRFQWRYEAARSAFDAGGPRWNGRRSRARPRRLGGSCRPTTPMCATI